MPNPKNVQEVQELEREFATHPFVFLTDYRGMSVAELANLRRQLRQAGVEYRVAKNTLLAIAARRVGVAGLERFLSGPTAVAFATENEIAAARALTDFARLSRNLAIKGGLLGRQVIASEEVAELAALPGKAEVKANLVGAIQGPMAGLVGVLTSALSSIVYALEQREKQLQTA